MVMIKREDVTVDWVNVFITPNKMFVVKRSVHRSLDRCCYKSLRK